MRSGRKHDIDRSMLTRTALHPQQRSGTATGSGVVGGGITVHLLQETDGTTRRLTLPRTTTPSALRRHLLAQGLVAPGQADGLRLRRRKEVRGGGLGSVVCCCCGRSVGRGVANACISVASAHDRAPAL